MADLIFREGTQDAAIWRSVAADNEYRIGMRFNPRDVVLDIGAHVGSFSYLCLDRGAGRVVCVEPDPGNFNLLRHNLHVACGATDRAVLIAAAADGGDAAVYEYLPSSDAANTGGGGIRDHTYAGLYPVAAVGIGDLIRLAGAFSIRNRVRLIKLDCEGSEWRILFDPELSDEIWNPVDAILGEYHPVDNFHGGILVKRLTSMGFHAEANETPGDNPHRLGKFWAYRRDNDDPRLSPA